jgi:hypothetical protein
VVGVTQGYAKGAKRPRHAVAGKNHVFCPRPTK